MTFEPGAKPGGSKTRSPVVRGSHAEPTTVQSVALARPASGRGAIGLSELRRGAPLHTGIVTEKV